MYASKLLSFWSWWGFGPLILPHQIFPRLGSWSFSCLLCVHVHACMTVTLKKKEKKNLSFPQFELWPLCREICGFLTFTPNLPYCMYIHIHIHLFISIYSSDMYRTLTVSGSCHRHGRQNRTQCSQGSAVSIAHWWRP